MTLFILYYWHWVVLGLFLIALEAFGIGGILLGASGAGFIIAGIVFYWPELAWTTQVIGYGFLTLGFTLAYRYGFKFSGKSPRTFDFNDRAGQLKGSTIQLTQDLPLGEGRTQIGDTLWRVRHEDRRPLKAGDTALVVGHEGMILLITLN